MGHWGGNLLGYTLLRGPEGGTPVFFFKGGWAIIARVIIKGIRSPKMHVKKGFWYLFFTLIGVFGHI